MNVSNVKAFVWTLPNPELLSERNLHDHSNCIFTKQRDNDEAEIITNSKIYLYACTIFLYGNNAIYALLIKLSIIESKII